MSIAAESQYNGLPLFVIKATPDDKFPFKFGVKKAELILRHLDDLKAFIRKHAGGVPA